MSLCFKHRSPHFLILLWGAWGLFAIPATADDPPPKVRATLDKAIRAHGGEDALAKLLTASWQGRGLAYSKDNPNRATPFYGEWSARLPDKFRYVYKFEGIGGQLPVTTIVNSGKTWRTFNDLRGGEELDEKRAREEKEEAHACSVTRLVPLLQGDYSLSPLPLGWRDGRYLLGVKVQRPGYRDLRLYFDCQLGYLTWIERQVNDPELNRDVLQETSYLNFKSLGGATLPQSITIKRDGRLFMEIEISKVDPKPNLDDKLFDKPPDPKSP